MTPSMDGPSLILASVDAPEAAVFTDITCPSIANVFQKFNKGNTKPRVGTEGQEINKVMVGMFDIISASDVMGLLVE